MTAVRSDAARSRARILEVARTHDAHDLRLNEVAREAGVGVGTVYRHFPTINALVEALSADTVDRLLRLFRDASAEADAGAAFFSSVTSALALQLENDSLQMVLLAPDAADDVAAARREIFSRFGTILERAQAAGAVRQDVTVAQLLHLLCGIEYGIRLGVPSDRGPLVDIVLAGLRPGGARATPGG